MRRIDDGHVTRPPPFRVLAAPDGHYLSPTAMPPPPPRAPEPYKIAPPSTTSSRAHRRSSFVIIADSRPASPEAKSPSPTLATGRASPFRGRGFKGPPPRSRSRPQSPDAADARRRSRNDRRVSVSQQNSPRRSLIPQPTRQRSTSLSKSNDRLSSPKLSRRADSRTRLNVTESRNRLNAYGNSSSATNLTARRQIPKTPSKLSPIQGTPTKPERTPQFKQRDRSKESTRSSPTKRQKVSVSPSKNAWNSRKPNQERNSTPRRVTSKERLTSPSKIPLKTNRTATNSLNPARFITISNQPNDRTKRTVDKGSKGGRTSNEQANETNQSDKRSEGGSKESRSSEKNADRGSELNLIEILKQTSGATGTSSVVGTTATTAVQPLHIDANTILLDKDASDKKSQNDKAKSQTDPENKRNQPDKTKGQADSSNGKSSNSSNGDSIGKQTQNTKMQNSQTVGDDQRQTNSQSSKPSKSNSNYNRSKGGAESRNDSPVPSEIIGGHSKNNSVGQSARAASKVNSASNNAGSATQRSSRNQNASSDQNARNLKSNDQKLEESSSFQSVQGVTDSARSNDIATTNDSNKNSSSTETRRIQRDHTTHVTTVTVKQEDAKMTARSTNEAESKSASNATTTSVKSNQILEQSTTTKTNNVSSTIGSVTNGSRNVNKAGVKQRDENHGSGMSVKSSTGVSVDSIESVRSTDTGVSVDTVRGSSPREKIGMHVVKQSQDIETLSGNMAHLEQNGEPAVPGAANGVGERAPERFFTRWKRSLSRCCEGCRNMRCLACRTDPKGGLAWPGNHARITTVANRNQQPLENAAARDNVPAGCWPRFKNRCRCKRLREMKCCSRRSRIAPAEATVCCPPERKFGAICRRLFGGCKCKRNADAERRRSIRAKHSLTSVAPPPLSEEPKPKIPDVLVEHNSLMRGAIPCLPVPLAWFCLVWNVLLPGSGTVWSGIFNLCTGQPRFSAVAGLKSRLGALVVNLVVGVGQLFTVLFCLVGWGWSIWWGVTLVRLARKYKRFKASEAASNDPEARGGEPAALPPGVPSHALRGMERTR